MPREALNTEEYLAQVQEQAAKHEGEKVKTHDEILQDYENTKLEYRQKTHFYIFLLVALVVSYLAVVNWKTITSSLGLGEL
jgi:hypothetical protein